MSFTTHSIRTAILDIAFLSWGPVDGPAILLLHGFPYDAYGFVALGERLGDAGMEVYGGPPERLATHLAAELRRHAEIVRRSGARLD